jgi:hypothetical protein
MSFAGPRAFAEAERFEGSLAKLIRVEFTFGRDLDYPFGNGPLYDVRLPPIVHGLACLAVGRRQRENLSLRCERHWVGEA